MRPTAFGRLGRLDEGPSVLRSKAGRWYGVLTFTIVVAISYVDRVNISVLITDNAFLDRFGLAGDRVAQAHRGIEPAEAAVIDKVRQALAEPA